MNKEQLKQSIDTSIPVLGPRTIDSPLPRSGWDDHMQYPLEVDQSLYAEAEDCL